MKIVHLDLAGFYTENMLYQTNLLAKYNRLDGHETTVISTNYRWEGAEIVQVPVCDKIVEDGIRLIRLAYVNPDPNFTHQKIRKVKRLYETLEMLKPDVILCHCTQFWSILDVIRYKKAHPMVKFYADTHTGSYNSGSNWVSLHILHRGYYRFLAQKALPHLEKYFYIGDEVRSFALENYAVPESIMEFYPLGGVMLSGEEYAEKRARRRQELGLAEDELLFVHSGKLDALKRTDNLLRAFAAVPNLKAKLAVLGSIPEDRKDILLALMGQDSRVTYLGWKSGDDLQEYLCACDLYCQPGGMSATMQNAICCNCAIMSYPHEGYVRDLDYSNFLWVSDEEDMTKAFRQIAAGEIDVKQLCENSARCARELLDYRKLAARLYR